MTSSADEHSQWIVMHFYRCILTKNDYYKNKRAELNKALNNLVRLANENPTL